MGGHDNQVFHKLAYSNNLLKHNSNYTPAQPCPSPELTQVKRYNEDLHKNEEKKQNNKDSCMWEDYEDDEYRITGV